MVLVPAKEIKRLVFQVESAACIVSTCPQADQEAALSLEMAMTTTTAAAAARPSPHRDGTFAGERTAVTPRTLSLAIPVQRTSPAATRCLNPLEPQAMLKPL